MDIFPSNMEKFAVFFINTWKEVSKCNGKNFYKCSLSI
jgi:hypothetical protein